MDSKDYVVRVVFVERNVSMVVNVIKKILVPVLEAITVHDVSIQNV